MRAEQCCAAWAARRRAFSGARRRVSTAQFLTAAAGQGSEEADARTRTGDPFITSEVLYQLSYVG